MLSICIPAYIHSQFTLEAVKTMLAGQEDFELIVVDDFYRLAHGSPEQAAAEELLDLLTNDPRATSFSNREQIPIYDNWNLTVGRASMPFVKLMGADDRITPRDLRRLLEILTSHEDATVHGHLARIIDGNGQTIRLQAPYVHAAQGAMRVSGKRAVSLKLAQIARLREPACNVFSKHAWQAVGGYPRDVRFRSDVTFNTRLLQHGTGYLWSEHLVDLRRHAGSDGRTLPAEMAARELGDLIDELYAALGADLTPQDQRNGEAWHLYRLVELAGQRYRREPVKAMRFILGNRRTDAVSLKTAVDSLAIVWRRLRTGDVQNTLRREVSA